MDGLGYIESFIFRGWDGVRGVRMHRANVKQYGAGPSKIDVEVPPGMELRDAPPERCIADWVIAQIEEGRLGHDAILTQESMRKLATESPNGPTELDPFGLLRDYVRRSTPDKKQGDGVLLVTTLINRRYAAIVFECRGDRAGIRVVVLRAFRYLIFKCFGLLPGEPDRETAAVT